MIPTIFRFFIYAGMGLIAEIIFTALRTSVKEGDVRLKGHSYIWMIPIYGSIVFIFEPLLPYVIGMHFILRGIIYALLIMIMEYVYGWILLKVTGKCPWEYTTGWHAAGLMKINYFPIWFFFGLLIEVVYRVMVLF